MPAAAALWPQLIHECGARQWTGTPKTPPCNPFLMRAQRCYLLTFLYIYIRYTVHVQGLRPHHLASQAAICNLEPGGWQ